MSQLRSKETLDHGDRGCQKAPHHSRFDGGTNGRLAPSWSIAPGAGFVDDPELTITAELNPFK